ncbi:MAG: 2-hydroxyacid dehydrogenase [Candidatus Vecturithrix sp.]|jgi:D-3-phosphoglycerate dehydrogenase|nr:2-hydroxyacid dehydrogenase [Candidatus Vecturithrix sp.]
MKVLAIGDMFIPAEFMHVGLEKLRGKGFQVDIREWKHATLTDLQHDNLLVEQQGPEALDVPEELVEGIEEYEILVIQFFPVSKRIIDRAKKLKYICVLRSGTENIDSAYAEAQGIEVLNTLGRNARSVAEFTLGMILAEMRNIGRAHAALKAGEWRKDFPNSEAIPELYEKTVGLIGFGNIGCLVAHYLHAFGSKVVVYDPYIKEPPAGVTLVSLEELLKNSDVVSIHARLSDETYHLIGAKEFALMKPNAIFVNTARSGLVDEAALIHALENKQIMGAAIDVFDKEPLESDHPYLTLDNITFAPHLAGSTRDAFANSPKMIAEKLIKKFEL